jgi:cell division protein FtsB
MPASSLTSRVERPSCSRSVLRMGHPRCVLVKEVQSLAERRNALEAKRNQLDDQLSELLNAIGKEVARGSWSSPTQG